jgi:ABC-type lipoprotein export system ATPase subunit
MSEQGATARLNGTNGAHAIAEARDIWKSYDHGRIHVLQGASLSVNAGEMVALWGPSGSGKSTLLHLLGGLDLPDRGDLRVCGLDPRSEQDRLTLRRKHIGFVFQLHNLIPDLTVRENLRVPAMAVGLSPRVEAGRIQMFAERVSLAHRLDHRIQDLSGGDRQRAAICRALMNTPHLILADEPTGSLDEKTAETVFQLLRELATEHQIAVILATHERRFAEACDRIERVREGRLFQI